jgi:hypothetical protein
VLLLVAKKKKQKHPPQHPQLLSKSLPMQHLLQRPQRLPHLLLPPRSNS